MEENPLPELDRSMLRVLCCGRIAQSVAIGAQSAVKDPENAEYVSITQKTGWKVLQDLWGMDCKEFFDAMRIPA